MKINKTIETINNSYRTLNERASRLVQSLKVLGHSVEWNYYSQHSIMIDGEPVIEHYPIPVITVKDVCDIGIDFMQVFVEGKVFAEDAAKIDLAALKKCDDFSIYGVESYLMDMYFEGMNSDELQNSISESGEKEVNIAVSLPGEPLIKEILDTVLIFRNMGTHVLSPYLTPDEDVESKECEIDENAPAFQIEKALMRS